MDHSLIDTELTPVERELLDQTRWFIRVRWLAGVSVVTGGALLRWGLGWPVSYGVEAVGVAVLLGNVFFFRATRHMERRNRPQQACERLANMQISVDLMAL